MKTAIKLVLKGILLWFTSLLTMIFITGIDSFVENSIPFTMLYLLCDISLIWVCYKTISEEEFNIISGNNLFNKYF